MQESGPGYPARDVHIPGGESVKAEFLFDFGSPNAYIAHTQVSGIESRTGVKVEYVPVLLGGVFKLTGNQPPMEAFKAVPAKLEYFSQDVRAWVEYLGIPYRSNPHFPVNTLAIMRGAVAMLDTERFADYVDAVFRAMWVDGEKMDDPAVIGKVLAAAGFDAGALAARTAEPEVKQKLIDLTQGAVSRGVFGSPAFFAGDRQFYGKDRMNLFEAAIERAKVMAGAGSRLCPRRMDSASAFSRLSNQIATMITAPMKTCCRNDQGREARTAPPVAARTPARRPDWGRLNPASWPNRFA